MAFPQVGGMSFHGPELFTGFMERDWARRDMEDAQVFSAQSAQRQMDFQERMSNTQWQRGIADMQAANLNPMLAYSQGGASSPAGAGFGGTLAHKTGFSSAGGSAQMVTSAQVENLQASADKSRAEAEEIRGFKNPVHSATEAEIKARIPTYAVSMDKMRQDIAQSEAAIGKIFAETTLAEASAAQADAQTAKLKAQLPEILAHIQLMREHVRLMAQQGKTSNAEEARIRQEIQANLPDIMRQLRNVETQIKRYEETGARLDRDAGQSLHGMIDRAVRSIFGKLRR